MRTKEEILDHLAHTVYTHKARKNIICILEGIGITKVGDKIKFASHTYNRNGEQMTKGLDYEDFADWVIEDEPADVIASRYIVDSLFGYRRKANGAVEIQVSVPNTVISDTDGEAVIADKLEYDFQVGDWVMYKPTPDETYTETVEAIANGTNGNIYLCLSNGEYVSPAYCIKYAVQGEERRKLIDKLYELDV